MTIPNDFPWRPGMRVLPTDDCPAIRVSYVGPHETYGPEIIGQAYAEDPADEDPFVFDGEDSPDLTDPATLGALLGAVREAWRSPSAHTRQRGTIRTDDNRIVPAWEVCDLYLDDEGARAIGASKRGGVQCALLLSEADALLAAWNARPRPT